MCRGMLILKFRKALGMIFILSLLAALAFSVQASEDKFTQDLQNLSHKDAKIRGEAAWALGKSGDTRAVGPLVQALKDGDRNVREWAVLALAKMGRPATEELIFALKRESELVRWQAAAALGLINDSAAVEPLIKALFSPSNETRYWAAISLGQIKDTQAREALIHVLGNGNQSVREASGRALLSIDGALGFDSLRALLKDSDSNRRVGAVEALARTGDERAVQPLIQALRDENGKVRAAAAEALGEINDSRAIEPLIQALADDDSDVRSRATDALAKMGRPASDKLILALENENILIKQGAAEALGEIKETRAIEPLISAFQIKEMRLVGVNALLKINKSSAVEPFIQILKDETATDDMRADASWALGEMGDPRAKEALLQTLATGKDNNVKMSAARALKQIKQSQVI